MQAITDTINNINLGEPVAFQGLTLFPVFGGNRPEPGYETLDVALEQEHARVVEVSDEGEVPALLFDNFGKQRVLLVDGDELVGAKQNRIINLTILVAAHSKIDIPVSCVEAGRWSYRSREFKSGKRSMYARARASKTAHVSACMASSGKRRSDQSAVWDDIEGMASALNVRSATRSMLDIYDDYEEDLEAYQSAFKARDEQVGAVFAVDGKVQGLELFDSSTTFAHYLERLVSSYALGSLRNEATHDAVPPASVEGFIEGLKRAKTRQFEALGEGEDVRLSGDALAGGALVAEGRVVHLAAFNLDDTGSVVRRHPSHWFGGRVE